MQIYSYVSPNWSIYATEQSEYHSEQQNFIWTSHMHDDADIDK